MATLASKRLLSKLCRAGIVVSKFYVVDRKDPIDAFMYGLRSKEELLFEADVDHWRDLGSRLVDGAPGRYNIELWLILLRAQALQYGHNGIKAIWEGLRMRGPMVRLDDDDPRVNSLWNVFVAAGSADEQFLWIISTRARESKFVRPAIYAEIVSAALESQYPTRALKFSNYHLDSFRGRDDLIAIFSAAIKSNHPRALEGFCKIYDRVPRYDIYSSIIPLLWEQNRPSDAFYMHLFLLSKGDLPDRFELLEPFIHHLASNDQSVTPFVTALTSAGASFEAQIRHFWAAEKNIHAEYPSISQNLVASKLARPPNQKLSDHFVARAFATRAFSFEFAVNTMRLLGLVEIGPLATREVVIWSSDASTLLSRFQLLRKVGVDSGASTFVRTIHNASEAGQWEIVQSLAKSDLHHETFADRALQERLLTQYYHEKDWSQVNRTLAIINMGKFGHNEKGRAATALLLIMLKAGHFHAATQLMSRMRQQNQNLDGRTTSKEIGLALRQWYQRSNQEMVAAKSSSDQLALLIGLLQDLVASGPYVSLETWRVPLIALAKAQRFKAFEYLTIWIAEWYRPNGLHSQYWDISPSGPSSNLNNLFTPTFQRMLVSWCFRIPKGRNAPSANHCMRWAPILKKLQANYGLTINDGEIWWTYVRRLRKIFSISSHSFIRHHNRLMRSRNRMALWEYWHMYKTMWDCRLNKSEVDGIRATVQGLYSTNRSERKWETTRRRGQPSFRFESTDDAAAVRAALVAKRRGTRHGKGHIDMEDDARSTVPYGRIIRT
ncbi:hypothetical protein LTR84_012707 [Exophiala bonariae]|uniref:Pentatricopeptide repeat domain-containing protein n=1 Tax=Exophiala bonariae TaxID=1690606 RepID=A0AAV9NH10_9EURO|nr:hypothetical protein LTR84_012707 [Exophiala bonariae]